MNTSMRAAVIVCVLATVAPSARQTPETGRIMREKLAHSQNILTAIMTSDFALLERHSAALARLTESPAWSVFNSPEYLRQSAAFLRAAEGLGNAAKQRDLDAAAAHYMSLTVSCFGCHRALKNQRIAGRLPDAWRP